MVDHSVRGGCRRCLDVTPLTTASRPGAGMGGDGMGGACEESRLKGGVPPYHSLGARSGHGRETSGYVKRDQQ